MEAWVGVGAGGFDADDDAVAGVRADQVRQHAADFAGPKLVCINVQPYGTVQAPERADVLNVGGSVTPSSVWSPRSSATATAASAS